MRIDAGYLTAVACEKFKEVDRYHRGLITSPAFSQALQDLGLQYGQQEVEEILRHCTITNDGYVHYKKLIRHVAPGTPRGKRTTAGEAIFPQDSEAGQADADRMTNLQRAYARWGRGLETNDSFKERLRELREPVSDELGRLLAVHGPSRNLAFGKLLQALQLDDVTDGRRARSASGSSGRRLAVPLSAAAGGYAEPQLEWQFSDRGCPEVLQALPCPDVSSVDAGAVHKILCDYIDGRMPSVTFRAKLRRHGIPMTQDIDRLIRRHDDDNSSKFQDFARHIFHGQCRDAQASCDGGASIGPSQLQQPIALPARPRTSAPFPPGGHRDDGAAAAVASLRPPLATPSRSGTQQSSSHCAVSSRDDASSSYTAELRGPMPKGEPVSPDSKEELVSQSSCTTSSWCPYGVEPPQRQKQSFERRPPPAAEPRAAPSRALLRSAEGHQGPSVQQSLEPRCADSSGDGPRPAPITVAWAEEPHASQASQLRRHGSGSQLVDQRRSQTDDHCRDSRFEAVPSGSCRRSASSSATLSTTATQFSSSSTSSFSPHQQQPQASQSWVMPPRPPIRPGRRHFGYGTGQAPFGTSSDDL